MVKLTAAALVLTAAFNLSGCNSQAAAPEAPRSALVAHPQSADTLHAEVYSGDVHARYESQLGFRVAGKSVALSASIGAPCSPDGVG
jgi:multidrug efflux system membrane fusion protein